MAAKSIATLAIFSPGDSYVKNEFKELPECCTTGVIIEGIAVDLYRCHGGTRGSLVTTVHLVNGGGPLETRSAFRYALPKELLGHAFIANYHTTHPITLRGAGKGIVTKQIDSYNCEVTHPAHIPKHRKKNRSKKATKPSKVSPKAPVVHSTATPLVVATGEQPTVAKFTIPPRSRATLTIVPL